MAAASLTSPLDGKRDVPSVRGTSVAVEKILAYMYCPKNAVTGTFIVNNII